MTDKKGSRNWKTPPGDDKPRQVCNDCGHIEYGNPKPIVGTVATWQGKILLCRRGIPPRVGYWTLPAGYMEGKESVEDAAKRETLEEAGAKIEIKDLLAMYDVPHASQVHLTFRGEMTSGDFKAGPESQEVKLFDYKDIPWNDLAFPINKFALEYWHKTKDQAVIAPERRTLVPFNAPKTAPKPPAP
jgi:ADP-ribose pyrophosphatase YjhB (NUDIX family)